MSPKKPRDERAMTRGEMCALARAAAPDCIARLKALRDNESVAPDVRLEAAQLLAAYGLNDDEKGRVLH